MNANFGLWPPYWYGTACLDDEKPEDDEQVSLLQNLLQNQPQNLQQRACI